MHCTNCGTSVAENAAFCPNCGTRMLAEQPATATAASGAGAWQMAGPASATVIPYAQPEERGRRVLGYLIDLVPMLLLSLIHLLPVIGWMTYGLIHFCYWLLRDINGASPGKLVMGSYVAAENGAVSTTQQRILRNVPLAIPGLLGMIPLIGWIFEFGFALVVFGTEALLLLATGRRLGDRLAGTNVFRK